MVRRGGHWLFISRVCEFVVVVFCFGAIVIVASDDFSNWYGVHYCCLSLQCSCVPLHLLHVMISGTSLEFLVVVAFHCDVLVCHCICCKW